MKFYRVEYWHLVAVEVDIRYLKPLIKRDHGGTHHSITYCTKIYFSPVQCLLQAGPALKRQSSGDSSTPCHPSLSRAASQDSSKVSAKEIIKEDCVLTSVSCRVVTVAGDHLTRTVPASCPLRSTVWPHGRCPGYSDDHADPDQWHHHADPDQ